MARIFPGDLDDPRIIAMILAHQQRALAETARGSGHALGADGLRHPDIAVWAIWEGDTLVGIGALRGLSADHGELKSMYMAPEARGKGHARAMLAHLIAEAGKMGHRRVSLETGSWDYFIPARALYAAAGFEVCDPFGDYRPDPNSIFMTRLIKEAPVSKDKSADYDHALARLQLGLVNTQIAMAKSGARTVIVFEGRDGAGKDGSIKRITEHLLPRATRVVALPKPSDRDRTRWYFQRYVAHLPAAGEIVIFNRSWYNRAGVERVMGFSTPAEQEEFLRDAPNFERMLAESGITLIKLWLDIDKKEQKARLDARRNDPLKALKVSDMDAVAQKKWKDYSKARDMMLLRTSTPIAPWVCVRANHKKPARLAIIAHILHRIAPPEVTAMVGQADPERLFPFEAEAIEDGRLAK